MQKKFENVKKSIVWLRRREDQKNLRIKNLKMLRESVKIPGRADVWVRRAENVNVLKQKF